MSRHANSDVRVPVNEDSYSIKRDERKCLLCGSCRSTCKFGQAVYGYYDLEKTDDYAICIDCGQCIQSCPNGTLSLKHDYMEVLECIEDKNKIVVIQTSPSVRVGIGDEWGYPYGTFLEGHMVSALKKLGFDYVFDTNFGADLTIMEEATELVNRIKNNQNLPMFTSCCPAWVKFVEIFYPDKIPNMSTCKSPILMQGAIIKNYLAKKLNIDKDKIVSVAVTPCTAKKAEIKEVNSDMDYIITTKELTKMLKKKEIDFNSLEDEKYDMMNGSSSGLIFGNSGGVMEAALRTAHYLLTKENIKDLKIEKIRGIDGIKEAFVKIGDLKLKVAVVSGTANARKILKMIDEGKHYDFIEVMACPSGCISGAGQPKQDLMEMENVRKERIKSMYKQDNEAILKFCHENKEIQKLYKEFLNKPGSDLAKKYLHRTYQDKSHLLGEKEKVIE